MILNPSFRIGAVGLALALTVSSFAGGLLPGKTARMARRQARLEKKLIQETEKALDSAAFTKFGSRAALSRGSFEFLSKMNRLDFSQMDVAVLMQMIFFLVSEEAAADVREMLADMKSTMTEKKKLREMMEKASARKEKMSSMLRSQFEQLASEAEKSPELVFEPYRESRKLKWTPDSSETVGVASGSGDVTLQIQCSEDCSVELRDMSKDQVLDTGRSGPGHGPLVLKGLVIGLTPVSVSVKSASTKKKRVFDSADLDIFYARPTTGNAYQPKCRQDGGTCTQLPEQMKKLAKLEAELATKISGIKLPETEKKNLARSMVEIVGRQISLAKRAESLVLSGYVTPSEKAELDSLSDLSQEQSLRLQKYMDRMTRADRSASNILKKFSEAISQIVSNLK
ncbi:MAG: hypothetical protein JNL01_04325 [Bdellovibrionales bacterium]|nr:hypothetical protein [Bdellovibrionales bacterium]